RFDQAVALALDLGLGAVLDFSPHPVLLTAVSETAASKNLKVLALPLSRRDVSGPALWAEALKALEERDSRPKWPTKGLKPTAGGLENGPNTGQAGPLGRLIPEPGTAPRKAYELFKASLGSLGKSQAAGHFEKLILNLVRDIILSEGAAGPHGPGHEGPVQKDPLAGLNDPGATPFMSLGLSSLGLIGLMAELSQKTGLTLSGSLVFSYPEARSLGAYLAGLFFDFEGQSKARIESIQTHKPGQGLGGTYSQEALAVVGAAARFPGGVNDLESYWRLLSQGLDAVGPVPPSRWDIESFYHPDREHPGTMYTREAGFIEDTFRGFDADFFGLAGREAKQLDPQQRLLLEMSWEAFELGAIDPLLWKDRKVGVFLGMTNGEYSRAHRDSPHRELIDAYSLTGTTMSGACGRISYFYGFKGPCFTVDTACSSGMVALSRAAQSLRLGESDLALVGAVTLMLTPEMHICFTKLGATSPDGRCKTFDDSANGYGRGEGGAVVLLKRLSEAQAAGDLILGLIRGAVLNQDGRSNGLTAPSGLAQRELIEETLAQSGLRPDQVDYVEAHGTGTSLGDSVELEALAQAYGANRTKPLALGSVKANIGHLEPAAALASLLKILVSMAHGQIPANPHLKTPNRHFDWASNQLWAPTSLIPWEREPNRPRRAGFSAFGFSGVNGHAIVEEYIPPKMAPLSLASREPSQAPGARAFEPPLLLLLSAKSSGALTELARSLADRLSGLDYQGAASLCRSLALYRPHHDYRLALVGGKPSDLLGLVNKKPIKVKNNPSVGLLFTGQGSQHPGMGLELYRVFGAFKESLDSSASILAPLGLDLLALLEPQVSPEKLAQTSLAQPLIAALSLALYHLWTSLGLTFSSALGHSVGEFPAMVATGFLSAQEALELVTQRGRLMEAAPGQGGMLAVLLGAQETNKFLSGFPNLRLAADNSPGAVTVAGPEPELRALAESLEAKKITTIPLKVSKAFHTPHMAQAAQAVMIEAEKFFISRSKSAPAPELISAATAQILTSLSPAYFRDQITGPVLFRQAALKMAQTTDLALEAGPSGALSSLINQSLPLGNFSGAFPSLKPGQSPLETILSAVKELYLAGVNLDYQALWSPFPGQKVSLPLYPFQRDPYWMEIVHDPVRVLPLTKETLKSSGPNPEALNDRQADSFEDPFLGARLASPALGQTAVFEKRFDSQGPFFLWEHLLFEQAVSPAAGHLAMILSAVKAVSGTERCVLSEVNFSQPLTLDQDQEKLVQVIIDQPGAPDSPFRIVSRLSGESEFTTHATGLVTFGRKAQSSGADSSEPDSPSSAGLALAASGSNGQAYLKDPGLFEAAPMSLKNGGALIKKFTGDEFYQKFTNFGYNLGSSFRRIEKVEIFKDLTETQVGAYLEDPQSQIIYPGTLDSILQGIIPPLLEEAKLKMSNKKGLFVPFYLKKLTLYGPVPASLTCQAQGSVSKANLINGTVRTFDSQG
ncbi:MAG: acyltransferase domain-containing protein, partial [Deltaproteobacteria bacterium]|nr:acyltransferase domain-containing protein [Deltaproteobacteria bacterium]